METLETKVRLTPTAESCELSSRKRPQQDDDMIQQEDLKAGPSAAVDSAFRLQAQLGHVLQRFPLGNDAGPVIETHPQLQQEREIKAALASHMRNMMAKRMRTDMQTESFNQLKLLIPSAAKMSRPSLLAATVAHIHELKKQGRELKERVSDLEQSNQSLRNQLLNGGDEDQLSSTG